MNPSAMLGPKIPQRAVAKVAIARRRQPAGNFPAFRPHAGADRVR